MNEFAKNWVKENSTRKWSFSNTFSWIFLWSIAIATFISSYDNELVADWAANILTGLRWLLVLTYVLFAVFGTIGAITYWFSLAFFDNSINNREEKVKENFTKHKSKIANMAKKATYITLITRFSVPVQSILYFGGGAIVSGILLDILWLYSIIVVYFIINITRVALNDIITPTNIQWLESPILSDTEQAREVINAFEEHQTNIRVITNGGNIAGSQIGGN